VTDRLLIMYGILPAPAARQIFATGGGGVQRRYRPTFANVKLKSHQ